MQTRTRLSIISSIVGALTLVGLAAATPAPQKSPESKVDFARDVRPILADKCFACHGPDDKHRMAGLRLDVREGALKKGASGKAAILPGKPAASAMVARISAKGPLQMPPPSTGKKLSPQQIQTLKQWIADGAPYAEHWAFVAPKRPAIPTIRNPRSAIRNPIDAFVVNRLAGDGMKPNPPADRHTLIRRISLDLIGLP